MLHFIVTIVPFLIHIWQKSMHILPKFIRRLGYSNGFNDLFFRPTLSTFIVDPRLISIFLINVNP